MTASTSAHLSGRRAALIAWGGFAAFLAMVPALALAWIALLSGWQTIGPMDARRWLLLRGSSAEALGVVAPLPGSVRYEVRGQDGNSPMLVGIEFRSTLAPAALADRYGARCRQLGFAVEPTEGLILCRRTAVELGITVTPAENGSAVRIAGWEYRFN